MLCSQCNKKIVNHKSKVTCGDCKSVFHCSCVNLDLSELEQMKAQNSSYRCDKCNALRRKSLQHQSLQNLRPNPTTPATKNSKIAQQNVEIDTSSSQKKCGSTGTSVTLQMLYEEIICIKKINCDFLSTINQLEEKNKELQSKIKSLENTINWREQKIVENFVEIVGVPDVNNQNVGECVQKIFTDALDICVPSTDVQNCYVKRIWLNNANTGPASEKSRKNKKEFNDIICVQFSSLEAKQK
ncbi:uncharacterized protein LOC129941587 [Eupeodes corollae]|uniref:uncharacterized protein LOC129941587 n=1 Tax=Eupeodes corollae TaxID=290404 RepID=UPI0024914321|nr:uncharacterized protein LOC129941587 [Eupeodes corollae]